MEKDDAQKPAFSAVFHDLMADYEQRLVRHVIIEEECPKEVLSRYVHPNLSLHERQQARWEALMAGKKEDAVNVIEERLFLGNLHARDPVLLQEHKIQLVIALGSSPNVLPAYQPLPDGVREHKVFIEDSAGCDILPHVRTCHALITEAHARGEAVLVHCAAGISRSAAIVIGHLILKKKWHAESALAFVQQKRPCVSPNPGFWRQLQGLSQK